jgi:N-sulfoglucosamine sulfohydrolase
MAKTLRLLALIALAMSVASAAALRPNILWLVGENITHDLGCFLVIPLMREMLAQGKLTGPPLALMRRTGPCEELFDTATDRDEIHDLIASPKPEHREALLRLRAALDTWIVETGDRGADPEAPGVVAPFEREMHDWFGTPGWAQTPSSK